MCGGSARNDSCGLCSKPTQDDRTSAFADCNNDCFGSAMNDSCGNCAGGKTGKPIDYAIDACGKCVLGFVGVFKRHYSIANFVQSTLRFVNSRMFTIFVFNRFSDSTLPSRRKIVWN